MRKICVVVGSRANYSSIKSVMSAIQVRSDLQLQVVVIASALLYRYGSVVNLIEADGFRVDAKVHMLIEGETPATMAKSTGVGLMELPAIFERLLPDIVVTVGDRFETMASTLAAAYMNIRVAHTMGGEVSGTIDESIRHAVTKFAHLHFPASREAKERIIRLGENSENVYLVGCPRVDLVAEMLKKGHADFNSEILFKDGVGTRIDLNRKFVIVSQHPVTTEYGDGESQITATLGAVSELEIPAIVLWPNADAGSEDLSRGIRIWRERKLDSRMHFFKNLKTNDYIHLMKKAACLIGNSSSGIREGAYIGSPVVNIGSRQAMRERGKNVVDVGYEKAEIQKAILKQIEHGPYEMEPIYGDGKAGQKIADILATCRLPSLQKRIAY